MGSHLIHLADRVAVQISDASPVLGQVKIICEAISKGNGDIFIPEHVDAFLRLKKREYIWLDAASNAIETALKRNIQNVTREFSMAELVAFSRLICRLIDFKSEFTATHSSGVAAVAIELSRLTGFSEYERRLVEISAYLHDLGKLAIPSEILEKAGVLTEEERFIMRAHVYHTYQALEPFEVLRLVSQWGALHQERLNGTGYPFGLGADDLPLGARIMAVADVFTALTEDRPYRKGMDVRSTRAALRSMADNDELDPRLLGKVFQNYEPLNEIRDAAQRNAMHEYSLFQSTLDRRMGSIRSIPGRQLT
jgi:HD-GYP domain-containing protein (c-di-GMP phosphodiesterase class II)